MAFITHACISRHVDSCFADM